MKIVLPSIRLPLSYPRNILHAPDDMMGYQLPCLDVDAGYLQIELLLRHTYGDKLTGLLCHDTMETLQLELGVGKDIFELPYKKWKVLATPCWMRGVWEFCDNYGFQIKVPGIKIPLLRSHDQYLTEAFVAQGYKGEELRLINLCRKWLQMVRLSEITTGDGRYIRNQARIGDAAIGRK